MTLDYIIVLQDSTGRICKLSINGSNIDAAIANGDHEEFAREMVESNAFSNAIAEGRIGDDATMVQS